MTAQVLVDAAPLAASGSGAVAAFGSGALLALPILLVVALLGRRRPRRG